MNHSDVLAGARILIVEDEPLLADELVDEIEGIGAKTVGPAHSVASALKLIETEHIDAALINVHLRGQMSFPVAGRLAECGIPFIFVTGNDQTVRELFPDVPSHPKPADMPKLISALGLLVSRHRALGSLP